MMVIQMMKNQIESLEESIQTRETVIAQQKADIDRLHNLLAEECGAKKRAEEKILDHQKQAELRILGLYQDLENSRHEKPDDGFDKPGKDFKYV